jgi:two-component system KDP operon response regulator KdpE
LSTSMKVSYAQTLDRSAAMNAPRILLVVGDPQVRRALRVNLMSAGHFVIEAWTGDEALAKVRTETAFDVVVLDLEMPALGGLEACYRIRKAANLPILVIGIFRDPEDKIRALSAGADDCLVKPFVIQDLQSHIYALQLKSATSDSVPAA